MEKPKRRSVEPVYSMCVQPSFIIGTNNENGSADFAPITWVSVTHEEGDGYLPVISMFGSKMTKQNVIRTGVFSANLVSTDMLPLMDSFGSRHAKEGKNDDISYPFHVDSIHIIQNPALVWRFNGICR
jgi:flavin reductase (DIM6/NTAB) family NADH-FMN oxidoreductase RutF